MYFTSRLVGVCQFAQVMTITKTVINKLKYWLRFFLEFMHVSYFARITQEITTLNLVLLTNRKRN